MQACSSSEVGGVRTYLAIPGGKGQAISVIVGKLGSPEMLDERLTPLDAGISDFAYLHNPACSDMS